MFINIQYVYTFATLVSIDLFHILFGTHHFPCTSFVVAIQTENLIKPRKNQDSTSDEVLL